jgi:tetratricopeptide (TPR) repeat protein
MIEATCSACGTLNRVSEANVPVGAKFITCADCKSRIAVAPPPPLAPAAKLPPADPATTRPTSGLDLTDLPAPKRASALGPLPPVPARPAPPAIPGGASKPAPRGGLAAALDPELPAPKMARPATPIDFADPGGAPGSEGIVDLPAPKRSAARPPVAEPTRNDVVDVVDLPAPKLDRSEADLPAPKRPVARPGDAPAAPAAPQRPPARPGPLIADLPTPRAADRAHADLPAPKGFFDDVPQPATRAPENLPAPKGFFDDLPQPPQAARAPENLPAPKGFFDDLPQVKSHPTGGAVDLPAPKGYFENVPGLPTGGAVDLPAPKGYFENVPGLPTGGKPEVPAPKGYFENIPGLPNSSKAEVPAPKGFFDDIPGLPNTAKPEVPAPKGFFDDIPGLPRTAKPEVPAPKGFFDDIPGLPRTAKPEVPAPKGFFDDLPQPGRTPSSGASAAAADLQLETPHELDLTSPSPPRAVSSFDDLELSRPAAPVRFDPPSRPAPSAPQPGADPRRSENGPVLELEGGAPAMSGMSQPIARRPSKDAPAVAAPKPATGRRSKALVLLLVVLALGAGGFVLYRRHVAAVERQAAITEQLGVARKAYGASDARHWQRAAAAAHQVVELDESNPEALGIGAESLLASAIAEGTGAPGKIAQAHAMLDTSNAAGLSSPILARARALAQLAAHAPDAALAALQPLAAAQPQDPALALYQGWALAAKGDAAGASEAYERALGSPATKLAALYGRGNARLERADLDGARADFAAALEVDKDHIGSQVGLAAAQPPAAAQRREADLLAILERKDIATADPRAVARAWTLAGDAAMRSGRYDVARERFRKALAALPQDLAATAELAETELRDGKVTAAAELTARALAVSKDDVAAQLVQSEIEIKQRRFPIAGQRLAALGSRTPPLATLEQARLQLVSGKLLEALGKDDEAADAYVAASRTARELDLEPMVAAVSKLAALTSAAVADRDTTRAAALRGRTDELLGNFAEEAARNPQLALMLGVGYLQAGNPDKAEPWLRHAVAALPKDAEARFQLGRALLKSGHPEDALEALHAAIALDPARIDMAAELARTYEALKRDGDAAAQYSKLLAGPEPGVELRSRAGRFYARTGAIDKAVQQSTKILEADPRNAAGLYLKGEGLLTAGKALEAKQQFQRAIEGDRDAQYLDALGRAAEALAQGGDREAQELALRSYAAAATAAPDMLNPLLAQGRLYVARHEAAKAVTPLLAASRLDPHSADVMFLLGAAYQEIQQPATARQWLEDCVKIAPNAEAYWRIGQIDRDANRGSQAVLALANATRLAVEIEGRTGKPVPWLTEALFLLGRVSYDLHNEAGARQAWEAYVARNPPQSAQLSEVKQQLATSLRQR